MIIVDDRIIDRARAALTVIAREARIRAAFLFGSYVEGEADEFSDIDIAAFIDGLENWDLNRRMREAIEPQREVGDDIELHFFPAELLVNPPKASFAAYIQNHGVKIDL
ncbi:MAG: nucleotidyltransferase domain-containing protein [Candidatus Coatesbacteria bacterium]|nr:nucleotidyltransferase domain-containing protein [Candidatus Coatesbacteria bacterium]